MNYVMYALPLPIAIFLVYIVNNLRVSVKKDFCNMLNHLPEFNYRE